MKFNRQEFKETTPKPVFPRPEECCGDSCPNCVVDIYFKDLEKWNALPKLIPNTVSEYSFRI